MAGAKTVVFTFRPFGKPAEPSVLAQGGKPVQPSGEQLVDIGLVPHIPDNLVPGHGKHLMQGDGQFHHSQVGGQMSPVPAGHFQDLLPDFLTQFRQLGIGDVFQIRRCMYGWQEFHKGPSSPKAYFFRLYRYRVISTRGWAFSPRGARVSSASFRVWAAISLAFSRPNRDT